MIENVIIMQTRVHVDSHNYKDPLQIKEILVEESNVQPVNSPVTVSIAVSAVSIYTLCPVATDSLRAPHVCACSQSCLLGRHTFPL